VALVLGLGNPGARYARTRHNVAWRVLETLVARWKAGPVTERDAPWRAWRAEHHGRRVDLLAPLTFMNLSGEALDRWRGTNGLEPGELLVIADDVYLPLGSIRLRARGSSGGHRGLESVEQALGSNEYARLRIGVGAADSSAALKEHVLEEFDSEEEEAMVPAIEQAADAVEAWLDEGLIAAMNRFNRRVRSEEDSTS
jgi:PTH1 family peptidyl-tRNA hydrolase